MSSVPHPSSVVLPHEWNEYTKAAWYERQLDAYNKAEEAPKEAPVEETKE